MKLIINEDRIGILKESVSDIVFHFTDHYKAVNILQSGKVFLSSFAGDSYANYKNMFYLSLSRVRDGRFGYSAGKKVRIEFDGRALNADFKGGAIDYWGKNGKSSYMDANPAEFDASDLSRKQRQTRVESEDRIISSSDSIDNLNKYIKRIDILFDERSIEFKRNVKSIIKMGESYSFPIEVFGNMNDFNKRENPITVDFSDTEGQNDNSSDIHAENSFLYEFVEVLDFVLYGNGDIQTNLVNILKQYGLESYYSDKLLSRVSNDIKNMDIHKFSNEFSDVLRFIAKYRYKEEYSKAFNMVYNYIHKNKINNVYKILMSKRDDDVNVDSLPNSEINFYVYNKSRILDLGMNILDIIFASDFIEFMQEPDIVSKHKSKDEDSYIRYIRKLVENDYLKLIDLIKILKSVGGLRFLSSNDIELTGVTPDEIYYGDYIPYTYSDQNELKAWKNKMLKKYIK